MANKGEKHIIFSSLGKHLQLLVYSAAAAMEDSKQWQVLGITKGMPSCSQQVYTSNLVQSSTGYWNMALMAQLTHADSIAWRIVTTTGAKKAGRQYMQDNTCGYGYFEIFASFGIKVLLSCIL